MHTEFNTVQNSGMQLTVSVVLPLLLPRLPNRLRPLRRRAVVRHVYHRQSRRGHGRLGSAERLTHDPVGVRAPAPVAVGAEFARRGRAAGGGVRSASGRSIDAVYHVAVIKLLEAENPQHQ